MNKEKMWSTIFWIVFMAWGSTQLSLLISFTEPSTHRTLQIVVFVLLWVVPIFWMICSGIILNGMYGYYLGWRNQHVERSFHGEVVRGCRTVDTTPAKRITLQWLAPFAAVYFLLSGKEKYKEGWIS